MTFAILLIVLGIILLVIPYVLPLAGPGNRILTLFGVLSLLFGFLLAVLAFIPAGYVHS